MSSPKTIKLQTTGVPVKYKDLADQKAKEAGYGGIQDVIRLFIKMYAEDKIDIEPMPKLTYEGIMEAIREYENGEGETFDSVEELLRDLNEEESNAKPKVQKKLSQVGKTK